MFKIVYEFSSQLNYNLHKKTPQKNLWLITNIKFLKDPQGFTVEKIVNNSNEKFPCTDEYLK